MNASAGETWFIRRWLSSAAGPAGLVLFVSICLFGVYRLGVYPSFERIERERAVEDHRRVIEAIRAERTELGREADSWAAREDLREFVHRPEGAPANPGGDALGNAVRMDLVWICDPAGRVLHARAFDADLGGELQIAGLPSNSLADRAELLAGAPGSRSFEGILRTEHGPMLLAGRPVGGPAAGLPRGSLLLGRFLDAEACASIADRTHAEFVLVREEVPGIAPRDLALILSLKPGVEKLRRRPDGGWSVAEVFADLQGRPAFLVRSESRREIAALGARTTLLTFLLTCLIVLAVTLGAVMWRELRRAAEERDPHPAGAPGRVATPMAATVLIGLALTLVAYFEAERVVRLDYQTDFSTEASRMAERMDEGFRTQFSHLESLRRFYLGSESVTRSEFREFVGPWLSEPGIRALAWIPRVEAGRREAYEAGASGPGGEPRAIIDRNGAGRPHPAAQRAEHLPVHFLEPRIGNEPMDGLDLAALQGPRAAFDRARDTGRLAITRNVEDLGLGAGQGLFLSALPLYTVGRPATTIESRRRNLSGYVVLVGRADETVDRALRESMARGLTATIEDVGRAGGAGTLFSNRPQTTNAPALRYAHGFYHGDHVWRIEVEAWPAYVEEHRNHLSWFIPPAGLLLTGISALYLYAILTRRRRAENLVRSRTAELRSSEERLALALEGAELGIWDFDLSSGKTIINERWARMLGYAPPEIPEVQAFWREHVHPDDLALFDRSMEGLLDGRVFSFEFEHRVRTRHGAWRWILSKGRVIARDTEGRPHRAVGTSLDITARRLAEDTLRRRDTLLQAVSWTAERLLRSPTIDAELPAVLERLGEAAGVSRVVIYESRIGADGFGRGSVHHEWFKPGLAPRSGDPLVNETDFTALGIPRWGDELRSGRVICGSAGELPEDERPVLAKLGIVSLLLLPIFVDTRFWGMLAFSEAAEARTWTDPEIETFRTAANAIGAALLRRQSDSALRDSAARMRQAQKLESLGVLAGGIAHDLNNMLTPILGNAELALLDLPKDSPARCQVSDVIHLTHRAAELARQMLAYSGHGHFVSQVFQLDTVAQEMAHLLKVSVTKRAVLRYELAASSATVRGDPTQIRQVILNLITNASEAIGDRDGLIRLSTGTARCDRAYLRTTYLDENLPEGDYAYIEVSDNGCGMDAETLSRVFDPFFTTKFTGRGLGLAVVLGIVRGHHGAIRVQSEPGRGTTFRVLLPAAGPEADEETERAGGQAGWLGYGTVLLADDEPDVRTIGRHLLERLGFSVVDAKDGREAVEVFRLRPHEIRAVVLDLTMPRMNGLEAAAAIRAIRMDVPIVLCSGYAVQDLSAKDGAHNITEFIDKPYNFNGLRNLMRGLLPD